MAADLLNRVAMLLVVLFGVTAAMALPAGAAAETALSQPPEAPDLAALEARALELYCRGTNSMANALADAS